MKIQYASDLHLEFTTNAVWLEVNKLIPSGEILVLAGDICYLNRWKEHDRFWDYCSENWEHTYLVPGNHEYYGGAPLEHSAHQYLKNIRDNVQIINNSFVDFKGVEIFFTTLWSILEPKNIPWIIYGMNDFRKIKYQGELLTAQIYEYLHKSCLSYLEDWLEKCHAPHRVVVSHHVPSEICNPEKFKGTVLDSVFLVDLTSFIESYNIDYWVYGHHHVNLPEQQIDTCKLVTNQLGYIVLDEGSSFRRDAIIDV